MKDEKSKGRKIVTVEQALVRLETMCARAEHCTQELRDKLWLWQIPHDEAERIIESLISRRFVDNDRFTRSFVNDKVKFAHWGPRKIAAALAVKRISRETVNACLDEIDREDLENNLMDLLEIKARQISDVRTYDGRTKLYRYGISRGYDPEMVGRVIRRKFI